MSQGSLSKLLSKPAKASEGQQWPVLSAGASPGRQVCPRHMAPTLNLALGKNAAMRLCCQQICWCSRGFQEGKQMVSWIGQEEFNRDGVSALPTTSPAKSCSRVAAPLLTFSWPRGAVLTSIKKNQKRQDQKREAQAPVDSCAEKKQWKLLPEPHAGLGTLIPGGPSVFSSSALISLRKAARKHMGGGLDTFG